MFFSQVNSMASIASCARELELFFRDFYYPTLVRSVVSGAPDVSPFYTFPITVCTTSEVKSMIFSTADQWNKRLAPFSAVLKELKVLSVRVDAYTANGGVVHVVNEAIDGKGGIIFREAASYVLARMDGPGPGGFRITAAFAERQMGPKDEWNGQTPEQVWKNAGALFGTKL